MQRRRLQPLDVATDAGRHRTVLDPSAARLRDVAVAAGLDPRLGLLVDGVAVDPATPVVVAGLRRGSTIAMASCAERRSRPAVLALACVAGPDVAPPTLLTAGRHVVGRASSGTVRLVDPDVEPHHLVLDVGEGGAATLSQVAGRVPMLVAGRAIEGPVTVGVGTDIEIGASRLRIDSVAAPAERAITSPTSLDPWRSTLVRTARRPRATPARWPQQLAPAPDSRSTSGGGGTVGAVGIVAGLVAAAAVAMVLRQPMFVLFAAVGVVVSASTAVASRVVTFRSRRALRREREADVAAYRAACADAVSVARDERLAFTPTIASAVAAPRSAACWERRTSHGDAFVVSLGWGDVPMTELTGEASGPMPCVIADEADVPALLVDVPVTADLADRPRRCIGIVGDGAAAVGRALVLQLAAQTGPADWRLVVATSDLVDAEWATWLPHADPDGDSPSVVDAGDKVALSSALACASSDGRRLVVLTDRPQLLGERRAPLRSLLDGADDPGVTVIVAIEDGAAVPAACDAVLHVGPRWRARWTPDTASDELPRRLHAAGVGTDVAARIARAFADLIDPEQLGAAADLPHDISISELPDAADDAAAILAGWRAAGEGARPVAAIGVTSDDVVEVDLVRDGPHALVAGTTGSGKSELLRTLVVGLAARSSPDDLTFVLIDYKGGSTFDACADLPHTVGVVTDLDDGLAARALVSLEAELRRRELLLRDAGVEDLARYRCVPGTAPMPRLVIVVDEFAALATELPEFLRSLVTVAQRGRSLGMHLVLATQRPSGVVDDHIRANTALRLALRLHDATDAMDVVGDPSPAQLPHGVPGRVVARLGGSRPVVFQAARCTGPGAATGDDAPTDLAVAVAAIATAASLGGYATPHRPWLEPLPTELSVPIAEGAVGLVDDPAAQRQIPLRWQRTGNLALIGSLGSGTTTALCSVIAAEGDALAPCHLHVYGVDATGRRGLDAVRRLAHCGGVVGVHEHERLLRLVRRLADEIACRRASGVCVPQIVVAVDGLAALRATIAELEPVDGLASLDRLLADGPALGVTMVATFDAAAAASVLQRFAERWVFHLDDPGDGPAVGVPAARVPPAIPGRIVLVPSGLAAHVATLVPVPGTDDADGPPPIDVLPAVVPPCSLDPVDRREAERSRGTAVPVGRRFDDLATATLHVPDGEHVLVVGPPGSGRTTALRQLVAAWSDRHPTGLVIHDPRLLDGGADGRDNVDARHADRVLLVLDDAEHVTDAASSLANELALGRGRLTVVAAGRGDALRAGYGTWIERVRRSRLGFVMAAGGPADGDVLGAVLPRRCPIAPRPGLAWMVDGNTTTLVQVAMQPERQLGSMP